MSELFDPNEWGPPLAVILAALTGGGFLLTRLRRQDGEAELVEAEAHRLDLENRRDEALQQLAALETQRDTMNPEDYAAERKALLQQGSQAMRELDQADAPSTPSGANDEAVAALTAALKAGEIDHVTYAKAIAALGPTAPASAAPASAAPAPASPAAPASKNTPGMSPAWQGAVYALVGAGLIGGLLYFISDAEQPRRDGASMTGNQDLGSGEMPPAGQQAPGRPAWVTKEIARAEAALKLNPEDLTALNTLTQLNLDDPAKAWGFNETARKVAPNDPDARMFEAVITSIMGMKDKAQEKFDALLEQFPEHGGIWAYKGLTLMEMKRYDDAAAALQKAKDLGIQDHSIDNALAAAKNGGMLPQGGAPGPKPAGNSPVLAKGTIDIDPGRATFKAMQLFVNISDPAMPGPPLAAVKLPPGPFPMEFVVTQADVIPMAAGRPLPAQLLVKARLDDDGNAFTRSDTDPQAELSGVAKGTEGLTLTLQ